MLKYIRILLIPLTYFMILLTILYRGLIAPLLPAPCRFLPTCSEYALQTLKIHGILGIWLIVKRLCKCHPFCPHGYDPPPSHKHKC